MTNTTQETEEQTYSKIEEEYEAETGTGAFEFDYKDRLEVAQRFLAARLKIEQSHPGKTLKECKDDYAISLGYSNWDHLQSHYLEEEEMPSLLIRHCDDVTELYAKQSQPKTVSDEDLCKAYTSFFGEVVDNKAQIVKICLTGEELFDLIKFVTGKQ